MPKYSYTAVDQSGKKVNGEIFGTSRQTILLDLKIQNLFPITLNLSEENSNSIASNSSLFKPKITKKNVATFLRQFASMLRSGMLIMVVLDVLIKEERNIAFKEILETINSDIMKGLTLSDAMAKHKIFPQIVVSMAEVGEANGKLDSSMGKVARSMENEMKLFAKLKSAMIYPSVLLIVTILASGVLTIFVLPIFAKMFQDAGTTLPPLTRLLLAISGFITGKWYIVLAALIFLVFGTMAMLKSPKSRIILDKYIYRIPVLGRVLNIMIMATFCRTLSSLLEGGVGVIRSLEIVRNVMNNIFVKSCFEAIIQDVKKGSSISHSICNFSIFTHLVISSVKIAEESGSIGEVLGRTAELYEEESESELQKLSSLLEPLVTVIMAIGVGVIVISIIQPMFQMYTLIGKSK